MNSNKLIKRYEKLIFEKYIGGQEIQVAVMNREPLGAIELRPKRNFYDYKAKYTKSAKTAQELGSGIESGQVSINHHGLGLVDTPFGGVKDSGYGSEGGPEGLDAYMTIKLVSQTGL